MYLNTVRFFCMYIHMYVCIEFKQLRNLGEFYPFCLTAAALNICSEI